MDRYDPPYNEAQLREHGYSDQQIAELKQDPVHGWRMTTGIELIHIEPSRTELQRIWHNWQLMTAQQQQLSDAKANELFGMANRPLYHYLLPQYRTERPRYGVVKYPVNQPSSSEESLMPKVDFIPRDIALPLWCADWIILECLETDYRPGVDKQSYRIYADAYHKPYLQLRPAEIAELAREHHTDILKFQHQCLRDLLTQMMHSYRALAEYHPSMLKQLNDALLPDLGKQLGVYAHIDDADGTDTLVRLQLSLRSYHQTLSQLQTANFGTIPDKQADKELCLRYIDKVINDIAGLFGRYADSLNYTAADHRTQLVDQGIIVACKTVLLLFNVDQPLLTNYSSEELFKLIQQRMLEQRYDTTLIDLIDSQIYHRSGLSLANAICLRPNSTVELPATYSSRLSATYKFLLAMMVHDRYLLQIRQDKPLINGQQLTPLDEQRIESLLYANYMAICDLQNLKDFTNRRWPTQPNKSNHIS